MTLDGSGSWGCGAFFELHWLQLEWPDQKTRDAHITVNELIPIVVGAGVWGLCWTGKVIMTRLDNMATVEYVNSGTCKDPEAMHLFRSLFFILAHLNFSLRASHIRGADNGLANGNNQVIFLCTFPQAYPLPTQIPCVFVEVLLTQKPDWTSTNWNRLFCLLQQLVTQKTSQ